MKVKNNHCPLCQKIARHDMNGLSEYRYCPNCKLGWMKTIPTTSYSDEYYVSGSSFLSTIFYPLGNLFLKIRESYVGFKPKKMWIDVGAGEGNFLETVHAEKKV